MEVENTRTHYFWVSTPLPVYPSPLLCPINEKKSSPRLWDELRGRGNAMTRPHSRPFALAIGAALAAQSDSLLLRRVVKAYRVVLLMFGRRGEGRGWRGKERW